MNTQNILNTYLSQQKLHELGVPRDMDKKTTHTDKSECCKNWKGCIQELILRNGLMENPFTLQGFLNLSDSITGTSIHDTLKVSFPKSNSVGASVRGTLQKLRDNGFLKFIDYKGTYEVTRSGWSGTLQE